MIWEKRSKGRRHVKRYYTSVQWKRFKKEVHFFFHHTCEWICLSHSHFGIIFHQSWGKVIQEQIWKSRNRVHFGSKYLPGIFNILFVCFFKNSYHFSFPSFFWDLFFSTVLLSSVVTLIFCIWWVRVSSMGFSGSSDGKESACNVGVPGLIPRSGRSPEKGMATHSSILAWRIP